MIVAYWAPYNLTWWRRDDRDDRPVDGHLRRSFGYGCGTHGTMIFTGSTATKTAAR